MELEFYGGNCFRIKTKRASVVIDDTLAEVGGKSVIKDQDVAFYTSKSLKSDKAASKARLVIDSAGEFEVGDLSVKAVQTRGHMDEEGVETANVFQFLYDSATVTVLGHVHPDLSDDVIEMAGGTDVLVVPVGGNGYTLDPIGAASVIKKIEPDTIVPSHYETKGLNFEVPASPLDDFIKASGMTVEDEQDSLKVGRSTGEAGQSALVVLKVK